MRRGIEFIKISKLVSSAETGDSSAAVRSLSEDRNACLTEMVTLGKQVLENELRFATLKNGSCSRTTDEFDYNKSVLPSDVSC